MLATRLEISDREFQRLCDFFFRASGIRLPANRQALVAGRLNKRLRELGLPDFESYADLLESGRSPDENELAVDLLTTNETYFFREPEHFKWLERRAVEHRSRPAPPFRVWSAACSTGEEPYTIALTLAEALGLDGWTLHASDLSMTVLDSAVRGLFPIERSQRIAPPMLKKWALRGQGASEGLFGFVPELREKISFFQVNLIEPLPDWEAFDVIFLRNVLIYFEPDVKRGIVERLIRKLAPDGRLVVGHAESLTGLVPELTLDGPAVYRRNKAVR